MIAMTTRSSSSAWTSCSTGWSACALRLPRHGPPRRTEQVNGVASEPNGGLDPLVARAIANLRDAAAHANGDASHPDTIDPNLLRQMRATLIEVFDSVFEHPPQRAARRKALDRRSRRR